MTSRRGCADAPEVAEGVVRRRGLPDAPDDPAS